MPLALILVRWLHLSASILLASLFLFEAAICPSRCRVSLRWKLNTCFIRSTA